MKKKLSKREAGKLLSEEGRLSPLEVFQRRLEYYDTLARQEISLGDLADGEKVDQYLRLAQEAGEALAPYRHPRLQATAVTHGTTSDLEKLLSEIEALNQGPLPPRPNEIIEIDPDKTRH
jgi:hypothetical protein